VALSLSDFAVAMAPPLAAVVTSSGSGLWPSTCKSKSWEALPPLAPRSAASKRPPRHDATIAAACVSRSTAIAGILAEAVWIAAAPRACRSYATGAVTALEERCSLLSWIGVRVRKAAMKSILKGGTQIMELVTVLALIVALRSLDRR
jgi:hypothetical protein